MFDKMYTHLKLQIKQINMYTHTHARARARA